MNPGAIMALHIIYRIGSLGDSVAALPALHALKGAFPDDRFILLCNRQPGSGRVLAGEILEGTGFFERVISYPLDSNFGRFQTARVAAGLWLRLRGLGAGR